jgi:hypothetical protein
MYNLTQRIFPGNKGSILVQDNQCGNDTGNPPHKRQDKYNKKGATPFVYYSKGREDDGQKHSKQ